MQSRSRGLRSAETRLRPSSEEPRVEVGPFNLALGRPANATVRGQFSRSGYNFVVQGDAEVQRLLEVARTIGLPAPQPAANGEARINLRVGGGWAGFAASGSHRNSAAAFGPRPGAGLERARGNCFRKR